MLFSDQVSHPYKSTSNHVLSIHQIFAEPPITRLAFVLVSTLVTSLPIVASAVILLTLRKYCLPVLLDVPGRGAPSDVPPQDVSSQGRHEPRAALQSVCTVQFWRPTRARVPHINDNTVYIL
jgi:hypothetical protein